MALKCLERPSRRIIQRCYSTVNSQPLLNSTPAKIRCATVSTPSIPSSTRSFTSASLTSHLARRSAPFGPHSTSLSKYNSTRSISTSTIRSATPQEAQGSKITASYIASAGELELVDVKKVLVIGSGGLSIGQAGEFDYSGMRNFAVPPSQIMLNPRVHRFASTQSTERRERRLGPYQPKYRHYTDRS